MPKPVFNEEKCEGCGSCIAACPKKCISPLTPPEVGVEIALSLCDGCDECGECIKSCERGALTAQNEEE